MAFRVLIAAALSALAMFAWGFVYWGPALNMMGKLTAPLPAEHELDVLAPLRAGKTPDGMYVYPGPMVGEGTKEEQETWTKKVEAGPIFHLAYKSGGMSPMDPATFAKGLAHSFVIALLAGIVLAVVAHALPGYVSRAGFLLLVTVIAAIWTNFDNLIWRAYPLPYCAGQTAYTVGAGVLMALITAAIVKPVAPAVVAPTGLAR